MRQSVLWCTLVAVSFAACAGDSDAANDATEEQAVATPSADDALLESVRQATVKYEDVNVALQDGYIPDPSGMCVDAKMVGAPENLGGMGIHYFRPDLLGIAMPPAPGRVTGTDATFDGTAPEILVYEPQADGSLKLVAVEYLVFRKAWEDAGNTAPPTFAGTTFAAMADDPATEADEAHAFEPHYELHVWLYRDNPTGRFAEFNPNVTCAHATHTM